MPAILGPFESSLRGRNPVAGEDQSARLVLHHSCSGASHGYGVKKEKHRLERDRERRNCSLPPDIPGEVPDILLDSLSGAGRGRVMGLDLTVTVTRKLFISKLLNDCPLFCV